MGEKRESIKPNKKGFTLTEILTVIVILAIVLVIAVPSATNYINKSRKKTFFVSVSNIVNKIKTEKLINESDYCMYDYSKDSENKTKLIDSMYVIAHKDNDDIVYSVYAKSKENTIDIDVYDFNILNVNNTNEWVQTDAEKSYSYFIMNLSGLYTGANNLNTIAQYGVCELKK